MPGSKDHDEINLTVHLQVFCKDLYMYSLATNFFTFKFSADNGLKCALNAHDLNFCKFLNHFTI